MQEGQALRREPAGKVVSEWSSNSLVVTNINDFGLESPLPAMALRPTGHARQGSSWAALETQGS